MICFPTNNIQSFSPNKDEKLFFSYKQPHIQNLLVQHDKSTLVKSLRIPSKIGRIHDPSWKTGSLFDLIELQSPY